ncbi:hypothetical protein GCM10023317_03890 [Actinopolymorpha pittospori]|uniref:Uncharacterized protein n=1 Tax=Actinopolymorpha pittospori TaxID=648752 RepID=A0A927R8Q6_9ACTN|nr:hypothetical protein [Actinopolymorpha pittospori]
MGGAPTWLIVGARVRHQAFGTGSVARVGYYKGIPSVWIDFDAGARRALDLQIALPFLTSDDGRSAATSPDPRQKCDVCGARPVVLDVAHAGGHMRLCEAHRSEAGEHLGQSRHRGFWARLTRKRSS